MTKVPKAILVPLLIAVGLVIAPASASAVPVIAGSEAGVFEAGSPIEGFSENLVFATSLFNVECAESEVAGEVEANQADPATALLTAGSFTGTGGSRCPTSSGSITVDVDTNVEEGWKLEAEQNETGGIGQITSEAGPLQMRSEVYVSGIKVATCYYVDTELDFDYEFARVTEEPTVLHLTGTTMEATPESSESCPASGTLSGDFVLSSEAAPAAIEEDGLNFGGTELNFKGLLAGAKKTIVITNKGTAVAWLANAWIQEGNIKTQANFKLFKLGGEDACAMPGGAPPFQKINPKDKCEIGVEFVSGTAKIAAHFVVELEGYIFNWTVKFPINS